MNSSNCVLFITLRKAGSQWIRDVLSSPDILRHTEYFYNKTPSRFDNGSDLDMPAGSLSGPIYGMNAWEWQYLRSLGDRAVVVLRDPRDLLVSNLFSLLYSHGSTASIDFRRRQLHAVSSDRERIEALILDVAKDIRMHLTWRQYTQEDALIVEYENLIEHEKSVFGGILTWLGWSVPEVVINDVVDRLSFNSQSGRVRGEHDKFSHHRLGVSGDWKNYFTLSLGEFWEKNYPGLLVSLGYESTSDWWRCLPVDALSSIVERKVSGADTLNQSYVDALESRLKLSVSQLEEKESVIQQLYQFSQQYQQQLIEKELVIKSLIEERS